MTTKSNIVVKRVQRAESQPVVHIGKSGMSLTPISAKGKTNGSAAWTSQNVVSKKISLRGHQKALSEERPCCVDIRKRYTTRSISAAFSTDTRTCDIVDESS